MKKLLFLLLSVGFGFLSRAQTASDYYQAPIDTFLSSRYLGEKRKVTVILPSGFSTSKATRFPLIVVFDRQNRRIFRQTFESINYLVSFDEMPAAVVIGISTDDRKRFFETSLLASTERATGEKFINFLYEELIPWAEKELNCGTNRLFIGHSRFGYFSSYLLANKLTQLTGVISCSPFFLQPNVHVVDTLKQALQTSPLNHTVYYRFITGDTATDTKDYALMKSFLSSAKWQKQFNWKGTEYYNARHFAVPGLGVMPSLVEMFDYWSEEMNRVLQSQAPFDRNVYQEFKQKMRQHYGDEIGLGLAVLNGIGYKFYNRQRYNEARQAWLLLLEEYPMFAEAWVSIADAYGKEGNRKEAISYYEQAKKVLANNTFYTQMQRQEMRTEIDAALKELRN